MAAILQRWHWRVTDPSGAASKVSLRILGDAYLVSSRSFDGNLDADGRAFCALRSGMRPIERLAFKKETVTFRVLQGKRGEEVRSVHIGIEVPDLIRFRLQPETSFDRYAKRLGLAREWQVDDAAFDHNVFVVCDDPISLQALADDAELRRLAFALMKQFGGATIRCSGGCLWLATRGFNGAKGDAERMAESVAHRAMKHLVAMRERIRAIKAVAWATRRDRSAIVEIALLVALELMGLVAIIAYFISGGSGENRQLIFTNTSLWTIAATFAVFLVLLPIYLAPMRRSSRSHLLLFEIVLIGVPAVAGLGFAGACWVNRHHDETAMVEQMVRIEDRYIKSGRRNRRNYYLVIAWPDSRVGREFGVSSEVFHQYDDANCVVVAWHRGHFDDPWMSGMKPAECLQSSGGSH